MKKKFDKYLTYYLLLLLLFSYYFLFSKHQVGNDSTISEWLINYEGGFTKRGIIGQICIEFARIFELNLRTVIFLFQSIFCTIYFILLNKFLKKLDVERILILSIFTPIFILYPVAEIEVLARKEIIVFIFFLTYLFIPREHKLKSFSFIIFTILSVLVWEPVIFFFPLIFIFEIIEKKINKFDYNFFKLFLLYLPSLFIALIIIFDPLSNEQHETMALVLKNEFNENCYMSCRLLKEKSSILQQFKGHYHLYSPEVLFRYVLIIIVGFFPLFILFNNSYLINKDLLIFKYFKKIISPFLFCFLPIIFLFAMGSDWGRWVNISYVFFALIYFQLLISNNLKLKIENLRNGFLYKLKNKMFVLLFIIYCFGWSPKTSIAGDISSFPGYRIPYKVFKNITN